MEGRGGRDGEGGRGEGRECERKSSKKGREKKMGRSDAQYSKQESTITYFHQY